MFGCLGNFIRTIVLILAVVVFFAIGGVTFFKDFVNDFSSKFQIIQAQKAEEIADFSKLDKEFEIVSSSNLPKIGKYVYIKHGTSSQKFYLLKPDKKGMLTKKDFSTKEADNKILSFVENLKILHLENFEITGRGTMPYQTQTIPYVKIKSEISNLPIKGIEGIVGTAVFNNENIIVIAINSKGKYSGIITEVLLQQMH
ncbi:MAG: hypothetical protein ACI37T_02295 [Candidatus Gastranaerophilaceae bacterium]